MTIMTRPFRVLLTVWLLTGFSTVLGSILGRFIGRVWLFAGAIAGAIAGVVAAVALVSSVGWLRRSERRGAIAGGIGGFIGAAAILFLGPNFDSPIAPVLLCSLAGVGALVGAGIARGWRGT